MAKPNYSFEKRQRELARKKKKDEKNQRKLARQDSPVAVTEDSSSPASATVDAGEPSGNT